MVQKISYAHNMMVLSGKQTQAHTQSLIPTLIANVNVKLSVQNYSVSAAITQLLQYNYTKIKQILHILHGKKYTKKEA